MENSKAFYKLTQEINELEEALEPYDTLISTFREEAKKLKKGSLERQDLIKRANDIKNSENYKALKIRIETMNFCINTVFYS